MNKIRHPKDEENQVCLDWDELTEWIDAFPPPETAITYDGEIDARLWAFRGVKDSSYELQPAIERRAESKSMEWAALESRVVSEFKARARTHLSSSMIPQDELSWLAVMQHYAIPTRLLDFTYSPYVALYFAARGKQDCQKGAHRRLYAVDVSAVNQRFTRVAYQASRRGKSKKVASMDPDLFATGRDTMIDLNEGLRELVAESLEAKGKRRAHLRENGCVSATPPPSFNPRLASQQGLFLLNCAEHLSLDESLGKMMRGSNDWQRTIDIPNHLALEIERKLFQMNIHDQSLFPDLFGLAGMIEQKIRLQWK